MATRSVTNRNHTYRADLSVRVGAVVVELHGTGEYLISPAPLFTREEIEAIMAKKKDGAAAGGGGRDEGSTRLPGAPDGSAYDFVARRTKIPRGAILTPVDGSPAFRVERSNGFVISGLEVGGKGRPRRAGIDLRQTDAGLDLSGAF